MRADVSLAIKIWGGVAVVLVMATIMYRMEWYPPWWFWRGFFRVLVEVLK